MQRTVSYNIRNTPKPKEEKKIMKKLKLSFFLFDQIKYIFLDFFFLDTYNKI